jgi:hypothetical protein
MDTGKQCGFFTYFNRVRHTCDQGPAHAGEHRWIPDAPDEQVRCAESLVEVAAPYLASLTPIQRTKALRRLRTAVAKIIEAKRGH